MKTGRNDPCPCGSGKKYKKCCMGSNIIPFPSDGNAPSRGGFPSAPLEDFVLNSTGFSDSDSLDSAMEEYSSFCEEAGRKGDSLPSFMEFQGRPNQASAHIDDLRNQMGSREFRSEAELEEFLNQQTRLQNTQGKSDFLGLSSQRMHSLLYSPLEDNSDFIRFNPDPDPLLAESVEAVALARAQFQALIENGDSLPLTPAGNLKRFACDRIFELQRQVPVPAMMTLKSEEEIPFSLRTRQILDDLGLIKTLKTKIKLTEKGRMLWEQKDWGRLFAGMFCLELEEYNWLYQTVFTEHCQIVQDSALFSLYMLKKKAGKAVSYSKLYDSFLKAFPLVEEHPTLPGGFNNMSDVYEIFFMDFFALRYGLCRTKRGGKGETLYVITDLFRDFISFGDPD